MNNQDKIALLFLGTKGAGPAYAFEMAKALSAKIEIVCIVSNNAENINKWDNEAKLNPNLKLYSFNTYKGIFQFALSLFRFRTFSKIAEIIRNSNVRVIYIPMGHFWNKAILNRVPNVKSIKTVHDVILHKGEDGLIHKFSDLLFNHNSDGYVVLNEKYVPIIQNQLRISEDKVCVIPHASFRSYGCPDKIDSKQYNRILFFGRIIKYKGLDLLLDAFANLQDLNLKLLIAGNGDFNQYKDRCKQLDNIELNIGWIKDEEVESIFKEVDIVVLPYISASQSGVIPLAYNFGKPVIATDIGALASQIDNGKTGFVIPVNNSLSIETAIRDYYSNPDKIMEMKSNALKYAKDNTWEKSADALINFIDNLS